MTDPAKGTKAHSQREIFISHTSADRKLAEGLFSLLQTGCGVPSGRIFCTSVDGAGIETGEHFVKWIHEHIRQARLVLLLVTRRYYESLFCVAEMGAAWALERQVFPMVMPGLPRDAGAVMIGRETKRINSKGLDDLRDRIALLHPKWKEATGRWNEKRDEYLKTVEIHGRRQRGRARVRTVGRAILRVSFDPQHTGEMRYVGRPGRNPDQPARFYHFVVTNEGNVVARKCVGKLIDVQVRDADGSFVTYRDFAKPVILKWANETNWDPIDIEPNLPRPRRLDLCLVLESSPHILRLSNRKEFDGNVTDLAVGVYRFTIRVSAENAKPVQEVFVVEYVGMWDRVNVNQAGKDGP